MTEHEHITPAPRPASSKPSPPLPLRSLVLVGCLIVAGMVLVGSRGWNAGVSISQRQDAWEAAARQGTAQTLARVTLTTREGEATYLTQGEAALCLIGEADRFVASGDVRYRLPTGDWLGGSEVQRLTVTPLSPPVTLLPAPIMSDLTWKDRQCGGPFFRLDVPLTPAPPGEMTP